MTTERAPTWRTIATWTVAGTLLWVAGGAMERRTTLEVFSDGGRIQVVAAGSTLTAPIAIESVNRLEIRATDSIFPPGGGSLELRQGETSLLVSALPSRFDFPTGRVEPLGDWEIDDLAGSGVVWSRNVEVNGAFELFATFTGRPHQHLAVTLSGVPTVTISFRRGLINNDLFVWDAQWRTLAVTSIDPQPSADLAAAAGVLVPSTAVACLLIAVFLAIFRIAPGVFEPRIGLFAGRTLSAAALAVALGVAAVLASLHVATEIFECLPHTPDSVVYLLQADWLTEGRLAQNISAIQDHLDVPFTYVVKNKWISHYPPGWPLVLAAGLLTGSPWIVAPVLGGIYIILIWWLGRRLSGDGVGLIAATLAVLSPMSRIIFSSYLSHAASSILILVFLILLLTARRSRSYAWGFAAGVTLGLCFGVRPLVAIAAAVPVGILLLDDLRRPPSRGGVGLLASVTAGGIAGAIPTLLSNLVITGNPLTFPYSLARGAMYSADNVPFGLQNMDAILASVVPALHGWGWVFSRSGIFLAIPLAFACIPFLLRRASREDFLLAGFFACLVAVHLGTRAHGLHGFGPRYYFEAFAVLFFLTARGFQELARVAPTPSEGGTTQPTAGSSATTAAAALLLVALCLPAAAVLPDRLRLYSGYNGVNGSLERAVDRAGLARGIVLFTTDDWRDWAMASRMMTDGLHDGLVFARSLDDNSALRRAYPDLPVFGWQDGTLTATDRPCSTWQQPVAQACETVNSPRPPGAMKCLLRDTALLVTR